MRPENYIKGLLTKEKILENVIYRMVNREASAEALEKAPHIQLLDLAAVYHCRIGLKNGISAELILDSVTCRYYGIQEGELDTAARRNTKAMRFSARRMSEVMGISEDCFPEFMYVLTNRERMYGASVILYPDYFSKLAKQMGTDLYILPSSIHEVIAVTVSGMEPSALQDLVKTVNGTEWAISPNEVLSNNVYRYSRNGGLTCVTSDTKRNKKKTGSPASQSMRACHQHKNNAFMPIIRAWKGEVNGKRKR